MSVFSLLAQQEYWQYLTRFQTFGNVYTRFLRVFGPNYASISAAVPQRPRTPSYKTHDTQRPFGLCITLSYLISCQMTSLMAKFPYYHLLLHGVVIEVLPSRRRKRRARGLYWHTFSSVESFSSAPWNLGFLATAVTSEAPTLTPKSLIMSASPKLRHIRSPIVKETISGPDSWLPFVSSLNTSCLLFSIKDFFLFFLRILYLREVTSY